MNKTQLKGHIGLCQQPNCFRRATNALHDNDNPEFIIHFCEKHFIETKELLEKLDNVFQSYVDNDSGLPLVYLIQQTKDKSKENE